jgi:hypothetical protein
MRLWIEAVVFYRCPTKIIATFFREKNSSPQTQPASMFEGIEKLTNTFSHHCKSRFQR